MQDLFPFPGVGQDVAVGIENGAGTGEKRTRPVDVNDKKLVVQGQGRQTAAHVLYGKALGNGGDVDDDLGAPEGQDPADFAEGGIETDGHAQSARRG